MRFPGHHLLRFDVEFTAGELFGYGIGTSIVLMHLMYQFVSVIWPIMGLLILLKNFL